MKTLLFTLLIGIFTFSLCAQNIDGAVINVAKIAPAYIKFNDKIKTAEFSTTSAYDNYLIRVRNDDNTLIIQYTGSIKGPDEGLTITEGNKRHFIIVSFLTDYDINKHKQLYYTYDMLKKNKKDVTSPNIEETDTTKLVAIQEQNRKLEESERQKEIAQIEQKKKKDQAELEKKLAHDRKLQVEKEKQDAIRLAKAEEEQKKQEKERLAALKKEANIKAEQEQINQKKIDEEQKKKLALEKEKQLEIAQKERVAKEAQELAARNKIDSLKQLELQNKSEALYSTLGLWKRYGSKGINLYEIPDAQKNWINSDFFIAKDTLENFTKSQEILLKKDRQIEANYGNFNKDVQLQLTDITFSGPFTYYKIKITNNTVEDFLTGGVVLEMYDQNKNHKQQIKCSYFTHISFYPIVKPQTSHDVVFVTRTPVIAADDDIIIYMQERRTEFGKSYIMLKGATILKELAKIERTVTPGKNKEQKKKKSKRK